MILSRPAIRRELDSGGLLINPPPRRIDQVSVNLRVGRIFTIFKELEPHIGSIRVRDSLFDANRDDLWETVEDDRYLLTPGRLVLAQTFESIVMPNHLMGLVEGRSSYARIGITAHLAAPKIDPGFKGTITLEMTNQGRADIELIVGEDEPAQLMFLRLSDPLEEDEGYGGRPQDIFQGQSAPIPQRRT